MRSLQRQKFRNVRYLFQPLGYTSHIPEIPKLHVKRFIEHLLPEGRALDDAVAANGLARSNVFGLIRALGAETAGVLV